MKKKNVELTGHLQPVFETEGPHSHFFGYYYNNPLDPKIQKLLAHRTDFDGRELKPGDLAEVGYFTLSDREWHSLGTTEAFNWQDGSMLQWIPGKEGVEVVHNLLKEGIAKGRRINLQTGESRILEQPIYALHPSGKWAIGVNFSRISLTRPGYGYREHPEVLDDWRGAIHPEDGLFRVDLSTGTSRLFLATKDVVAVDPSADVDPDGMHYLHHPMWNPDGSRFIFLHRYTTANGSFKTRLFSASAEGDDLFHFPDAALFSHAAWRDEKHFTIWSVPGGGLMGAYAKHRKAGSRWIQPLRYCLRLGRKLFKGERALQRVRRHGYYEMRDKSTEKTALAHGLISIDGHPTWYAKGNRLLADTYQDAQGFRHLLSYNTETHSVNKLGAFFSPFNNCGYRCDLHPRIDQNGEFICIDSAHSGQRQMYIYQLSPDSQ